MATLPFPPWRRFRDVLAPEEHRALLDWTLANRDRFRPSEVLGKGVVPEVRISERLRKLEEMRPLLEGRLRPMLTEIFTGAGSKPFEPDHIELEAAAHGDGAFFARHSDLPLGPDRTPTGGDGTGRHDRIVSAVLYYHKEPKRFSGGALRLHRFGGGDAEGDHVDIEPEQNSLVVFPSWALHEVRPVSCASGRFEHRRFAINIWLCREIQP